MTTPTPADELRTAAKALRAAALDANRASPAPWRVSSEHLVRAADRMPVADRSDTDHPADWADLPYIALMHPGVGAALANWLDTAATNAAVLTWPNQFIESALAVARQINGTP